MRKPEKSHHDVGNAKGERVKDLRVTPSKAVPVGELSVENKTSNSIIVRYDRDMKSILVVDCCLEEQGK